MMALASMAQADATSVDVDSESNSQSSSGSFSALQVENNYDSGGTLRNTPSNSAPSFGGGGHPCLAGSSGSINLPGFGIGGGGSKPEGACMLWVFGQPEAAIMYLAADDGKACEALGKVGYYTASGRNVPFMCGEQEPIATGYDKCFMEGDKVKIRYRAGADKHQAKTACLESLGY